MSAHKSAALLKAERENRASQKQLTELRLTVDKLLEENQSLRTRLGAMPVVDDAYAELFRILIDSYDQASSGKGQSRHGQDRGGETLPFGSQPMQAIGALLHSPEGMLYQAVKKSQEGHCLLERTRPCTKTSAQYQENQVLAWSARSEFLGAINYLAGAILFIERQYGIDPQ